MNIRDLNGLYVGSHTPCGLILIAASNEAEAKSLCENYFKSKNVDVQSFGKFTEGKMLDTIYFNDNHVITKAFMRDQMLTNDICDTTFSVRAKNVLKRGGITTLYELSQTPINKLKTFRNMGETTLDEIIKTCLETYDIELE